METIIASASRLFLNLSRSSLSISNSAYDFVWKPVLWVDVSCTWQATRLTCCTGSSVVLEGDVRQSITLVLTYGTCLTTSIMSLVYSRRSFFCRVEELFFWHAEVVHRVDCEWICRWFSIVWSVFNDWNSSVFSSYSIVVWYLGDFWLFCIGGSVGLHNTKWDRSSCSVLHPCRLRFRYHLWTRGLWWLPFWCVHSCIGKLRLVFVVWIRMGWFFVLLSFRWFLFVSRLIVFLKINFIVVLFIFCWFFVIICGIVCGAVWICTWWLFLFNSDGSRTWRGCDIPGSILSVGGLFFLNCSISLQNIIVDGKQPPKKRVKVGLGEIFAEENIDVVFGMLSVCSMQFLRNVMM